MTPRPLFLFSLPRSGSTLVQRILASHPEIATAAEPWVLLPQLYAFRESGTFAEYGSRTSAHALEDFALTFPGGRQDYEDELRTFVLALYERASRGKGSYFLDKTPRYHLVVDDVIRLFPEGKFLFLWRNPLAVVASVVETWAGGRWTIGRWRIDLYQGLDRLVTAYRLHADGALGVRFEDLVADPERWWPRVFSYLELRFDASSLEGFRDLRMQGRMGDTAGDERYEGISTEPIEKWKATLANPFRKAWGHRYLAWIGRERLATMGYDIDELAAALDELPSRPRFLASDLLRAAYGRGVGSARDAAFQWISARGRW